MREAYLVKREARKKQDKREGKIPAMGRSDVFYASRFTLHASRVFL